MATAFEFILNGRSVRVADVSPNTTLLEYLRGNGLTGSKEGCAEGDCGACSVAIIERNAKGQPTYRAVNSCLMPVCLLAGREVVTVEGVGCSARPHPVQQKMVECFGSQCGYCTPGFICSMFEGYYRDDLKTVAELEEQLAGNLCRCTGYRPIRDAAMQAFANRKRDGASDADEFLKRLERADVALRAADYVSGEERFLRPTSLAELLALLQAHPEARLVAGATELGLEITKRFKKFPTLISTEAVAELKEVKATTEAWFIGAAVTLTEVEERLSAEFPFLGDMLRVFGSRQIRNRATMGGNLVTASPIGDSAPCLLALDAQLVLIGATGERTVAAEEFFVGYRKTALRAGEVLKAIVIPRGPLAAGLTRKSAWFKVSKRCEMDISTVAAAFVVDVDAQNIIRHVRLGYGGVAATPMRARKTEAVLVGQPWSAESIQNALPVLRTEFAPISDVRGTAEFRSGLVTSLLEKFYFESESANGNQRVSAPIAKPKQNANVATAVPHESAHKHVTGEAMYVDDQTCGKKFLEIWPVCSPHAHARILKRDATVARQMPGIKAVLLAEDIPGRNDVGAVKQDEILLADNEVFFHGHLVAIVVGETLEACRAAAERVVVEYEPLPPILTLREAIEKGSFHNEPNYIRRGDVERVFENSAGTSSDSRRDGESNSRTTNAIEIFEGEFEFGGQEHFYLETQAALAEPGEDGSIRIVSSTQHPSEVQQIVSHVLHLPANRVVVEMPRMGGGFGGKETQAATPAALAALAAHHTKRPVRVRFNRDQDMMLTGHRHPFLTKFKVAHDAQGKLLAVRAHLWSNGGWAQDLSQAVTDRALFHLDNSYYIPAVEFRGQVAKTNHSSNTAFRGFGGPQGMLVIEEIIDRVARRLNLPPEAVRERNLYHDTGETNTTHYGQLIEDNRIQTIWRELKRMAELEKRRKEITAWNATQPHRKRGLAMTPVKFGISFTVTHLNQAGALVLIYQDGTVQVNHGGTEMGQGLHTNVAMIAAQELGVKLANIRVMPTSTDKVPNTSATAASAGTDLNGAAVKNACETLRARLSPIARALLNELASKPVEPQIARGGVPDERATGERAHVVLNNGHDDEIDFQNGDVFLRQQPERRIRFEDVVRKAYLERVSLSATGFYATPEIHWDRVAGRGKPFYYFAYGAAVTEVEVDGLTGLQQVLRVDILHDVGRSVNDGVNRGQIEGGFIQGMGWLTAEELVWNDKGVKLTHSPDTYKIPSIGDTPKIFNVTLLPDAAQKKVVHGSKAVGEPPFMLAISVREAIRDAVAAFGSGGREVLLASPATCEAIWRAIQRQRTQSPDKAESASAAQARMPLTTLP